MGVSPDSGVALAPGGHLMPLANEYWMSGMRVIPSVHATVSVELRAPVSGDMTEMVDTLRRLGYVPSPEPGAYHYGGCVFVHPEVLTVLQYQMQDAASEVSNKVFAKTVSGSSRFTDLRETSRTKPTKRKG